MFTFLLNSNEPHPRISLASEKLDEGNVEESCQQTSCFCMDPFKFFGCTQVLFWFEAAVMVIHNSCACPFKDSATFEVDTQSIMIEHRGR